MIYLIILGIVVALIIAACIFYIWLTLKCFDKADQYNNDYSNMEDMNNAN